MSDASPAPLAGHPAGQAPLSSAEHPPYGTAQEPAPLNAIAKLAMATQVLLMVCGVLAVAIVAIETFGIGAIASFLNGNDAAIDMLDVYDRSTSAVSILSSLAVIAAGVLWMVWQYRVAKQVTGRTRRTAGRHVGSWLIPIVSLWFPYQNISDLWRAVGRTRPSWQIVWWLLFIASNFVTGQSTRAYLAAEDLEQFRVAMWMSLVGATLLLAAAPLAWLIVRGITQGVLQRSTAPDASEPAMPVERAVL